MHLITCHGSITYRCEAILQQIAGTQPQRRHRLSPVDRGPNSAPYEDWQCAFHIPNEDRHNHLRQIEAIPQDFFSVRLDHSKLQQHDVPSDQIQAPVLEWNQQRCRSCNCVRSVIHDALQEAVQSVGGNAREALTQRGNGHVIILQTHGKGCDGSYCHGPAAGNEPQLDGAARPGPVTMR